MKLRLVVILLVIVCFLVAPAKYSTGLSETVSDESSNCDWPCWGGNPAHTFSVADSCAPDVERMKLLWDYDLFSRSISYIIINNLMYIEDNGKIRCVDLNGELLWTRDDEIYTNMVITDFGVISTYKKVTENTRLICLDFQDGSTIWITESDSSPYGPDLFSNSEILFVEKIFFESEDLIKYYYCMDPKNGTTRYKIKADSSIGFRYKVFSEDSLIVREKREATKLISYNLISGEKEWEHECSEDFELNYTPIFYKDSVYAIEFQNTGVDEEAKNCNLLCVSEKTGELEWSKELDCKKAALEGISKDLIFITEYETGMSCYSSISKEKIWSYNHNGCYSSTAISNGMIFFSSVTDKEMADMSESFIHCLNINTGKELWTTEKPGRYEAISIADNKLFSDDRRPPGKSDVEYPLPIHCWGTPPPKGSLHRLSIEPSSILINYNQQYQFSAITVDIDGSRVSAEIAWSVDPKSAGTITQDGLFTPDKRADKCVIKATSGGKVAFALVTIVQAVRIKIEPSYIDIRPGEKVKFTATILDSKGKGIIGVPKMWSLSDPKLGEISPLGEFTAGTTGGISGNVFCTFGSIKGKAKINIINVNMENAVSFESGTVNFGEIVSGHEKTLKITLKNNVGVSITVDIAKFGSWFEVGKDKLTIPANSEKMIELTLTNTKNLKPGTLYIGKIRASWDDGVAYSQVMVRVTDE